MSSTAMDPPLRIDFEDVKEALAAILRKHGFPETKADLLAHTFAESSLDGIYTHGLNRFPRFIETVKKGQVQVDQEAVLKQSCGAVEQWDGQLAAGILNALQATDRAMELAKASGIGCVALANTNHWMRGGTYGWRAAKRDFVFIGWTNTIANMPAWGAIDAKLGNNPLVLSVPYEDDAIVLDMALSQFSYGALELRQLHHESLPVPGGFNAAGELTQDPAEILDSQRVLPVGYWKGAGLSLVLDILAATLSGGLSTAAISEHGAEYGVSQVFIAIDTVRFNSESFQQTIRAIVEDYRQSQLAAGMGGVRYPGEGTLRHRRTNRAQGIPVDPQIWAEIGALA